MKSKKTSDKIKRIIKGLNILVVITILLTSGILDPLVILAEQSKSENMALEEVTTDENQSESHVDNSNEIGEISTELLDAEEVTHTSGDFDIRLLEIQPSNDFTLGEGETGSVIKDVTIDNQTYKVLIEKISMPEFIGKTEQINGYYDIVVIGRKTKSIGTNQRDYSGINFGQSEHDEEKGIIADGNNNMIPNGNYVENDITKRKSKELIEYINTGQLFVMNTEIFNIENAENSNLNSYFNTDEVKNKANVTMVSKESELQLKRIISDYLKEYISKRCTFKITSTPTSDSLTASKGDVNNRNLKFNLNLSQITTPVSVRLYLDVNGDGLYQEKEVYYSADNIKQQNNYEFIYDIGNDFFGWLDWKIQLEQNGVKSYEVGNVYLKPLVENYKKTIRVLQIMPDIDTSGSKPKDRNTLDLTKDEVFKSLVKNIDYNIVIETIRSGEFSERAGNPNAEKPLYLNGKYDMIIIGFADNYGKADITGDNALNEIQKFIDSGQSVMFTHDTMALRMEDPDIAAVELTEKFRDIVGQARFLDVFTEQTSIESDQDYLYTLDGYKIYDPTNKAYKSRLIPHIDVGTSSIIGHSLLGRANFKRTGEVYKTNSALITNYPYELSSGIAVAQTHNQWYQLNLEDEDVVPWFNLVGGKYNQFDSRNNYYTYSKGNITYSGTGDSTGFTEEEFKLFVNTIVKADRGANHAPTITSSLEDGEGVIEIPGGLEYPFTITVRDIDGDPINATIKAKVNGETHTLKSVEKINQGSLINVTIPSNLVGDNNKIEIIVEASDIQGASATPKTYMLQASREAQISVNNVNVTGLVGDAIVAKVDYQKIYESNKSQITDITFDELSYNSNVLTITERETKESSKEYLIVPKTTLNNEEISGKIKYRINGQTKEVSFKIYVNVRAAEVNLKIVDKNGTLLNYIDIYATIYGSESVKVESGEYKFVGSEKVRLISNIDHQLGLELPTNYELSKVSIKEFNEDKQEVVKDQEVSIEQGIINIPTFNVSYDNPYVEIELVLRTDLVGEIRILEIEPADKFKLSKTAGNDVTGTEIIYEKANDGSEREYKISIDHITMPEFIGSVEKLNGKYDIIVIGRYVHDWTQSDPKNQEKYKDYNFTRTDEKEENDITNRKAEEIKAFINSGQLVYLDKNILNEDIRDTKLYRNFEKVSGANFITSKSISELTINEIIDYYTTKFNHENKRLQLQVVDATPSDITTEDKDVIDGIASNRNRKMYIQALSNTTETETYSMNLYLDLDGDGLFSDDEIAVKKTGLTTSDQFLEIDYDIHPDFIGLLEWKLEVSKGNTEYPIKTYLTGVMNFHRLPEKSKKKIKVLQIAKDNKFMWDDDDTGDFGNSKYEVLDLSKNKSFNDLLSKKELKDYDITIQTIDATTFNNIMNASIEGNELVFNSNLSNSDSDKIKWYNFTQEELIAIKELNGYYDMIILGFTDAYDNAVGEKGIAAIKEFIETGQGLMLTHDTLLYSQGNVEKSTSRMISTFRALAGQARYSGLSTDLNGTEIIYDKDQPAIDSVSDNTALSEVLFSGGSLTAIKNAIKDQSGNLSTLSTQVYETNSALITSYPFNLVPEGASTILIRRTHGQYLQLNLEDEVVVPWYTYTEYNTAENPGDDPSYDNKNDVNPYDVRNNYYTYSRENITYSGTGEQKRERSPYPTSELMLFINTIIKAERGANHAPTVDVRNLSEGMLVSKYQEKLNFTVIPTDMDLDKMKLTINVEGCNQSSCTLTDIDFIDEEYIRTNGESVNISLDIKDKLPNYESIKIVIKATDSHGADSKSVSYNLKVTEDKLLTFHSEQRNYLIGDTAPVNVTINSTGTKAFNGEYQLKNIPSQLTLKDSPTRTFELDNRASTNLDFKFKVDGDSTVQVGSVSTLELLGEYKYCLGQSDKACATIQDSYESFINIKRGRITLNFESNVTGLFLSHEFKAQLLKDNKVIAEKPISSANEVIFDTIPTGTYSIRFFLPTNLSQDDYRVEKNSEVFSWDKEYPITVDYDNNHVIEKFNINEVTFDLVHGLFESQTDNEIIIEESNVSNLTEVVGNTLVNFGATFTTKKNAYDVTLRVSDKFKDFTENSIRILKVVNNNDSISLQPLSGINIEQQSDSRNYNIKLPKDLKEGTNILVFYTGLVPNENISLLTNTIIVGATIKDVSIGVKANDEDKEIPNSYLPNLF